MKKSIKGIFVTISLFSILLPSFSFASSTDLEKKEIQERLINSPAKYEYTSRTADLNKDKLYRLKTLADRANNQNSASSYVSLASYLLGLTKYGGTANALGGVAYLIQADLDAYGTLSYAFSQYRYLDTHPKVKTVKTRIKYKRFFDGNRMHPWYPYSKPSKA